MQVNAITCSSCKRVFHRRMRHCPFCGAERKAASTKSELPCPLCKTSLESTQYRNERVSLCPDCKGMWLEKRECDVLTSERHAMTDDATPFEFQRGPLEQRTSYIPCPACGKPMIRENFRKLSGIIVDRCGDHGTWFDTGELDQIRAFVANGGVTRSQDKQIEENKEGIDTLRFRVGDLELMEKILHKWDLKRIRFRKL